MKAVLLAAGKGTRLNDPSAKPKCLLTIAGKTLLHWQTRALRHAGVRHTALVTGYRSELLVSHARTIFHNSNWNKSEVVTSLMKARHWLRNEPCIISFSDILYNYKAVDALQDHKGDFVVAYDTQWESLWEKRYGKSLTQVETFKVNDRGHLTQITKRAVSPSQVHGKYMGLFKITPDAWKHIENNLVKCPERTLHSMDMTDLLIRMLNAGQQVDTCPLEAAWCDIDTQDELTTYESLLKKRNTWSHDWR